MKSRIQLVIIVLILVLLGSGLALYKYIKLGFPLTPTEKETVWTVEATITFTAEGGPARVSLNLADAGQFYAILERNPSLTRDFISEVKGGRAIWEAQNVSGPQTLFLQSTIYRRSGAPIPVAAAFEAAPVPTLEKAPRKAAENIVKELRQAGKSAEETAVLIMAALNDPLNPKARRLLDEADDLGGKLNLAAGLLNMAGVKARAVKGLDLAAGKKKQKLKGFIQIQTDEGLKLISPRSATIEDPRHFLLWSKHDESILEITGGSGGELSIATTVGKRMARSAAIQHGKFSQSLLVDFSIYSLPLVHQNTFKLLLMIPLGALIVVILRNIVGIQTAGTFMPILIALVFLQVDL
ncbi:MAG: UUP1 family membrane protein, partial [Desulfobacterales bacterium]|nr:UUP1 family membrane protein [Desulfobacterales bacterium]